MSSWRGDVGTDLYFQTSTVPNKGKNGRPEYFGADPRNKKAKSPGVSSRQERSIYSRAKPITLHKAPWEDG